MTVFKLKLLSIMLAFTFLFNSTQISLQTQSQYLYLGGGAGIACAIPLSENGNFSLLESNVQMTFKMENKRSSYTPIKFDCNYTFSNNGSSSNVSLFFPIYSDLYYGNSVNYTSRVNGTEIDLQRDDRDWGGSIPSGWFEYLITDEIEMLENSTLIVGFTIESMLLISRGREDYNFEIYYIVDTIHWWKEYNKKTVKFIIDGIQPYEYSNYSANTPQKKCLITNYVNSSSYLWNWENEQIIEERVNVEWLIPRDKPFTFLVGWDFYSMLLILSSSLLILVNRIRIRKKRCLHE